MIQLELTYSNFSFSKFGLKNLLANVIANTNKNDKEEKVWLLFDIQEQRGEITISDLLAAPQGKLSGNMIKKWFISVWNAYCNNHKKVPYLLTDFLKS